MTGSYVPHMTGPEPSARKQSKLGVSRSRFVDRDEVESAIARGVPNSVLMERYGFTYEQLVAYIAGMNGDLPPQPEPHTVSQHGTEVAWRRHQARGEARCELCTVNHEARIRHRAERRRAADRARRQRGAA